MPQNWIFTTLYDNAYSSEIERIGATRGYHDASKQIKLINTIPSPDIRRIIYNSLLDRMKTETPNQSEQDNPITRP